MKTIIRVSTLVLALGILITSCNNNDPSPTGNNPKEIPVQTSVQPIVTLGSLSTLAVLAGASVTSTGATVITATWG